MSIQIGLSVKSPENNATILEPLLKVSGYAMGIEVPSIPGPQPIYFPVDVTISVTSETSVTIPKVDRDWWSATFNIAKAGTKTITVVAKGRGHEVSSDPRIVSIIDTVVPTVDITSPEISPYKITWTEGGVSVGVAGTASDPNLPTTNVQSVKWRLDGGTWEDATNISQDWSRWTFRANIPAAGLHDIEVRATDGAGNQNTDTVQIDARGLRSKSLPIKFWLLLLFVILLITSFLLSN